MRRDRQNVELARLDYFPDLTASVMWNDVGRRRPQPRGQRAGSVGIGMSVNVPLYRKRLDAGVRERGPGDGDGQAVRLPARPDDGRR